jgi:hypothetical protein
MKYSLDNIGNKYGRVGYPEGSEDIYLIRPVGGKPTGGRKLDYGVSIVEKQGDRLIPRCEGIAT